MLSNVPCVPVTGTLEPSGRSPGSRERPLVVYFGHHKAGTRWARLIIEELARVANLTCASTSSPKWFGHDLQAFVDDRGIDVLSYTNAEPRYLEQLRDFRGVHIIRDPRDMVVSAYFSHLLSHTTDDWPELVEHRGRLADLSTSAGLLADIAFTARLSTDGYELRPFDAMRTWDYARRNVLELRFETVIDRPVHAFASVVEFMDLPVGRDVVAKIVQANRFEVLTGGRAPGSERVDSHYRRGVPGDWRHHLKPAHLDALAAATGDVVTALGYR
jgi:hypothetical protein